VLLVLLTLVWGINWPVMKLGVSAYPPLSFRGWSLWLGVPVLAAAMLALKVPFSVPRRHWGQLLWLATTNMFVWHVCIIVALESLSSGRAAILGYTMPIFSAVLGALFFAAPLAARGWVGVGAAAVGVTLLLWHEFTNLAGRPTGVLLALLGAASWALGTQLLRRARIDRPTLTLAFWMTAMTAVVVTAGAALTERHRWGWPPPQAWWAIVFNAVLIFGFAHATWYWLARHLPPLASTLSVMFIPVLGVFSGAVWLGEPLHWQDWAAVALMVVAIASVLLPARRR
jgi:drug/metabolite transporter (DMT)-like permease